MPQIQGLAYFGQDFDCGGLAKLQSLFDISHIERGGEPVAMLRAPLASDAIQATLDGTGLVAVGRTGQGRWRAQGEYVVTEVLHVGPRDAL